jgi:hypothetical protein
MTRSRKSQVAIAVVAASLAGAGAAVAESSHAHSDTLSHGLRAGGPAGMHDDLSVAATYLGLTESELRTTLRSGKTLAEVANATDGKSADGLIAALIVTAQKNIAADVSSGRLTQAQADQLLSGLKQHITARVNSVGPPGGRHGHGGPHAGLDAAATYLGLSDSALRAQLQSGKTLGEVADATAGKSKAGLVAALVADEKSHLAQAVKDGRLTQAQADTIAADIASRVTDLVNGTLPARPGGPPPGDGPPRGNGMAPPA